MKSVVKFIKEDCVYHSKMIWSSTSFFMAGLPHKVGKSMVGIYFITVFYENKLHVLKVGKADGKQGFYKRFNMYTNLACDEYVVNMMPKVMKQFPNGEFRMYYHCMEPKTTKYKGYTIPDRVDARGFEEFMSTLATEQGHPMLLSKCK